MGYKSDVRIVTTKKGYDFLKKYVTDRINNNSQCDHNLLDHADLIHKNKELVLMGWNFIKWYERSQGYEEIDYIMEGLEAMRENSLPFNYTRIGEEPGDIDELEGSTSSSNCFAPSYSCEFKDEADIQYIDSFQTKNTKVQDR